MLKSLRNKSQFKMFKHSLIAVFVIFLFYVCSLYVAPGWVTYLLSTIAMVIIAITALVRANDLGSDKVSGFWQIRRLGLVLSGVAALSLIVFPLATQSDFASWKEVLFRWGVALVWLTSPNLPPWWKYMSGKFTMEDIYQRDKDMSAERKVLVEEITP